MVRLEATHTKSKSNKRSESAALRVLLTDRRFQDPDLTLKKRLLSLLDLPSGSYGTKTFDAIMTPLPEREITADNVHRHMSSLRLVEMKSTLKAIEDATLNGFFFGATDNEYQMARALGDRYLFAFVVLGSENYYRRPFAVLLTLDQVTERTKQKRLQYQVNFRTDMDLMLLSQEVIVFGSPDEAINLTVGGTQ